MTVEPGSALRFDLGCPAGAPGPARATEAVLRLGALAAAVRKPTDLLTESAALRRGLREGWCFYDRAAGARVWLPIGLDAQH
jgi:hypothetical protein